MNCNRATDRLQEYLEGSLRARRRRGIEAHLRECPRCARFARWLRAGLEEMRAEAPCRVDGEFTRRVMKGLDPVPQRRRRLAATATATAAVAILAATLFATLVLPRLTPPPGGPSWSLRAGALLAGAPSGGWSLLSGPGAGIPPACPLVVPAGVRVDLRGRRAGGGGRGTGASIRGPARLVLEPMGIRLLEGTLRGGVTALLPGAVVSATDAEFECTVPGPVARLRDPGRGATVRLLHGEADVTRVPAGGAGDRRRLHEGERALVGDSGRSPGWIHVEGDLPDPSGAVAPSPLAPLAPLAPPAPPAPLAEILRRSPHDPCGVLIAALASGAGGAAADAARTLALIDDIPARAAVRLKGLLVDPDARPDARAAALDALTVLTIRGPFAGILGEDDLEAAARTSSPASDTALAARSLEALALLYPESPRARRFLMETWSRLRPLAPAKGSSPLFLDRFLDGGDEERRFAAATAVADLGRRGRAGAPPPPPPPPPPAGPAAPAPVDLVEEFLRFDLEASKAALWAARKIEGDQARADFLAILRTPMRGPRDELAGLAARHLASMGLPAGERSSLYEELLAMVEGRMRDTPRSPAIPHLLHAMALLSPATLVRAPERIDEDLHSLATIASDPGRFPPLARRFALSLLARWCAVVPAGGDVREAALRALADDPDPETPFLALDLLALLGEMSPRDYAAVAAGIERLLEGFEPHDRALPEDERDNALRKILIAFKGIAGRAGGLPAPFRDLLPRVLDIAGDAGEATSVRKQAILALAGVRGDRDRIDPFLLRLADDPDREVAATAASSLGRRIVSKGDAAHERLRALLDDPDPRRARAAASGILGWLARNGDARAMLELAGHTNPVVRKAAASELASIRIQNGTDQAIHRERLAALRNLAFTDPVADVRVAAAVRLFPLVPAEGGAGGGGGGERARLRDLVWSELRSGGLGSQGVADALRFLRSHAAEYAGLDREALRERLESILAAGLEGDDLNLASAAMLALDAFRLMPGRETLERALASRFWWIRAMAASDLLAAGAGVPANADLGRIASVFSRCPETFTAALSDGGGGIDHAAMLDALRLGRPLAPRQRTAVRRILFRPVLDFLDEAYPPVAPPRVDWRTRMKEFLVRWETHRAWIARMARAPDRRVRLEVMHALTEIAGGFGARHLLRMLWDEDPEVRRAAHEWLVSRTQEDFGYDPDRPPEGNGEALGRIRDWWKREHESLREPIERTIARLRAALFAGGR